MEKSVPKANNSALKIVFSFFGSKLSVESSSAEMLSYCESGTPPQMRTPSSEQDMSVILAAFSGSMLRVRDKSIMLFG